MIFYVPPDRQAEVRAALAPILLVPFRFESTGSVLLDNGEV